MRRAARSLAPPLLRNNPIAFQVVLSCWHAFYSLLSGSQWEALFDLGLVRP
jgi:hypothetical protein